MEHPSLGTEVPSSDTSGGPPVPLWLRSSRTVDGAALLNGLKEFLQATIYLLFQGTTTA